MAAQTNVRFVMDNAADDATLSDGNSNILASLPEQNLQKSQRTKVVRTSNTSDLIINISWGGLAKFVSSTALMRHNLTSDSTWRVQLYADDNQSGAVEYDSGVVDAIPAKSLGDLDWGVDPLGASVFDGWDDGNRFTTIWFTQVTAKSARITVSDSGNADGYLQASRLIMGISSEPIINVDFGLTSSWQEQTKQVRSEGGSLRSDTKPQYRTFDMTMGNLSPGERSGFFENVRTVGLTQDFLVSVFPTLGGAQERDYTMQCKLTRMPTFSYWAHDLHKVTFNVAEA